MVAQMVVKFFKDFAKDDAEDLDQRSLLKNCMQIINQDLHFRYIARFEYEIDPNDITRGFKAVQLRNHDEINLQHKKAEMFIESLNLL